MPSLARRSLILLSSLVIFAVLFSSAAPVFSQSLPRPELAEGDDPSAPAAPVKLVFIHHSTGGLWLADNYGTLGLELMANNYFVSDTNYGWGPNGIGSYTDLGNWYDWFRGANRSANLAALLAESGQNNTYGAYSRLESDPGGENEIIVFKSCFPNSALKGSPSDPIPDINSNPLRGQDASSPYHTLANVKGIYLDLLNTFAEYPQKLFVVITAPPLSDSTYAANARALNTWLMDRSGGWLKDYALNNVAVFDFYNVLTTNGGDANTSDLGQESGNHHRWWNGSVQEKTDAGSNTLAYPSQDDHPSPAGEIKAAREFAPLLNVFYHRWKNGSAPADPTATATLTSLPPTSTEPASSATATSLPPTATNPPATATRTASPTATRTSLPANTATTTPTGTGAWVFCANENGTCTFSGTYQVRYGANNAYNYRTASNGIACTNAVFGDPAAGTVKTCSYWNVSVTPTATPTSTYTPLPSATLGPATRTPLPSSTFTSTPVQPGSWVFCANENQTCAFSGTYQVRYGANNVYNYRTATNGIACTNAVFGDPIVGIAKSCAYLIPNNAATATSLPPTQAFTPTFTASPTRTVTLPASPTPTTIPPTRTSTATAAPSATHTPLPTSTPLPTATSVSTRTSTSFLPPSANAAQTTGSGDKNGYQTAPANAYVDDNLAAVDSNSGTGTSTSCTSTAKDRHQFYNFNFALPAAAAVQGIEVRLDARADSTSGAPKICAQISWDGGATWTDAKTTATLTKTQATYILGGAADTWGRAWSADHFSNTGFRVRLVDISSNTSRDFYLEYLAVNVTYQP